jgi:hypothetical protein
MRPPGTYLLPIHDPKSVFTNQTYAFAMHEDWKKAARIQREGPTRIPPPFEAWQWKPTVDHVRAYLRSNYENDPGPWSVDFEATLDGRPVCVGFWSCNHPTKRKGIIVPVLCQGGGNYWSDDEWPIVYDLLYGFFTDPHREKIGHNLAGYDCGYIDPGSGEKWNSRSLIKKAWGIDVVGIIGDTMAAHHTCFPELKTSLAFLASMTTDMNPFKLAVWEDDDEDDTPDKGKPEWVRILERPDEKTRCYCLCDNFAQAVSWNVLVEEMA